MVFVTPTSSCIDKIAWTTDPLASQLVSNYWSNAQVIGISDFECLYFRAYPLRWNKMACLLQLKLVNVLSKKIRYFITSYFSVYCKVSFVYTLLNIFLFSYGLSPTLWVVTQFETSVHTSFGVCTTTIGWSRIYMCMSCFGFTCSGGVPAKIKRRWVSCLPSINIRSVSTSDAFQGVVYVCPFFIWPNNHERETHRVNL